MRAMGQHPFLSFAFRPFYLLAALFGATVILLWAGGFQGAPEVSGFLWHAREMVWGYTGAIIVSFLLTAVATWTGQPQLRGIPLALLVLLWLLARGSLYLPYGLSISAVANGLFYLAAVIIFAQPIIKTRNRRNYLPIAALLLFGVTGACFDGALFSGHGDILNALFAGTVMVAAIIGFVGMRVIPFFTARRLNVKQVTSPQWVMLAGLLMPALAVLLLLSSVLPEMIAALCIAAGVLFLVQLMRWWSRGVLGEPLLWILFVGFGFTGLGLIAFGWTYIDNPAYLSAATHLITVGGIGVMTLGMMARTALGHTGRAMKLSAPMPVAFWLMTAAAVVRPLAFIDPSPKSMWYYIGVHGAGTLFALALLLFVYRYLPYLWHERADANNNVLKIIR